MLLKYFYDSALAHASYLVGCQRTGEAIVIDPDRSVQQYVQAARREGLTIVGTAETHIHADYVSGSRELAEQVGAKLFVSDEGPADWKYTYLDEYPHQLLLDGDEFRIGNILFQVMSTPGHTPESISLVLTDEGGGANQPMGIFTGDFVFVGSIGRPDLLEEAVGLLGTAAEGAGYLYCSLNKLRQLPDFVQLWPAHGAGSACGKGLGAIPSTTLGYEKLFNPAFQIHSEDEFVKYILRDQPEAPPYFALMKSVNKHGPKVLGDIGLPPQLAAGAIAEAASAGQLIDTGQSAGFAEAHVTGSINIPSKLMAMHGCWLVDYKRPLYLIANRAELPQTVRTLREIGADNIAGWFDADQVRESGAATESYSRKSATELSDAIAAGEVQLVDVRRQSEWDAGHIPQAKHMFLGRLASLAQQLDKEQTVVFQCQSGARSAVACSLAQSLGFQSVINLDGGFAAWKALGLPTNLPGESADSGSATVAQTS